MKIVRQLAADQGEAGVITQNVIAKPTLQNRGLGADGIHRVQVDERTADEDGVINRKTGFIELTTAEFAVKAMQDLQSGKKVAVWGAKQQRGGNIYTVTLQLAAGAE